MPVSPGPKTASEPTREPVRSLKTPTVSVKVKGMPPSRAPMAETVVGWEITKFIPKTFCPAWALDNAKQLIRKARIYLIRTNFAQKMCQYLEGDLSGGEIMIQ